MISAQHENRTSPPFHPWPVLALALAALVAGTLLPMDARAQEDDPSEGPQVVYRVGLDQGFTAALDSAPQTVDWEQLRSQVAIRLEFTGSGKIERQDVVFHALLLQDGEVKNHHRSDPVEIIPGATKFDPDSYLPEGSMLPDGAQFVDTMGFGVVEVPAGEFMSSLLRDIVMPMTEGASALYIVALPPEDQRSEAVRAYPILLELGSGGGA